MGISKHFKPSFSMDATAIVESTRGLVSFYEPLEALLNQSGHIWSRIDDYCHHLSHYPRVMDALSRLHANSMMDFEKGLFCGVFSVLVAEKLKIEPKRVRSLYYAGLTQDVGIYMEEFSVSDYFSRIGQRIGPNSGSTQDRSEHKSHALVAYSLLEDAISDDSLVAELVLHHHANEDGTGYPNNVGEAQLSIEKQILIVANQLTDLLWRRGGFDALFECRPQLKLASTMFFKPVNGAAYDLLQRAAEQSLQQESTQTNTRRLNEQLELLDVFASQAIDLSSDLIDFEHYQAVRALRDKVKKIELLMNETGLLNTLDERCVIETRQCLDALPEFLEPMTEIMKELHRVLSGEQKHHVNALRVTLKRLLMILEPPKTFSLFI